MPVSDIILVLQWWSVLFLVGAAAFPITKRLFSTWYDRGYLLSKAVGCAVISYFVYVLGTLHIAPFTQTTVFIVMGTVFIIGVIINYQLKIKNLTKKLNKQIELIVIEELLFFLLLLLWSWVKAHEPSIRGLEKFMDYGFMQSILNARYFPASDMWWAGGFINYYYFGHLVTAVLTKVSGLSLANTFNLMLATLFALTATMSFSIGYQLTQKKGIFAGVITSFLVTLAGNMQTVYAFTKGYTGEDVKPFWELLWPISEFFSRVGEGMQTYWYANATRFIPFTIHEFPSYSFVVSDVHGHVLSLPFVLLAIALLIEMFKNYQLIINNYRFIFYSFLLGILLMTNALDGPIYGLLFAVFIVVTVKSWKKIFPIIGIVAILTGITSLPFLIHFNSFATGIGVNCPPAFLAGSKIGPFIFEGVDKCQRSPFWMMWLLWGFFWFSGVWLFVKKLWKKDGQNSPILRVLKVFYIVGIALIIFPEFLYVKDIYPAHFRSNTMFKLGYQAFIWWSIIAGFVITHVIFFMKEKSKRILRAIIIIFFIPQVFLVSIFPIFSIRSYFGELKMYKGIYGLEWVEKEMPGGFAAIQWLRNQFSINNYQLSIPTVIVEAAGDSYTDFNHISAFTGLPTITGWAVHEWLWRGSYDIVSPRQEEVRNIYESTDVDEVQSIIGKYHIRYVIVGSKEREKYPNLQEEKFRELGRVAFQSRMMTIYEMQ